MGLAFYLVLIVLTVVATEWFIRGFPPYRRGGLRRWFYGSALVWIALAIAAWRLWSGQ